MIRYSLKCDNDHSFESWFQSAEAFDKLDAAGMLTCSVCGSPHVKKAVMAPRVTPARKAADPAPAKPVAAATSPAEQALSDLRKKVEENADYVGDNFAHEARAIHTGDAPDRPIYGEAKPAEAKSLIEDGVPVAPLPFIPRRKSN